MIAPNPSVYRALARQLVTTIDVATRRQDGARRANLGPAIRAALRGIGGSVPIGDGDVKIGAPGTYRPVGATCAPTCPYLGAGCYAESGKVALHQREAAAGILPALRGAAGAMAWAAMTGRPCRLHVSGDLGRSWDEARPYIAGLIAVVQAVRATFGPVDVWTYTHLPYTTDGAALVDMLATAGIHVRWSDRTGYNGAIVVPFERVASMRQRGRVGAPVIAKCPAQLRDTTCADCRLCWQRPDLTIAFDPHGSGRRSIAARANL